VEVVDLCLRMIAWVFERECVGVTPQHTSLFVSTSTSAACLMTLPPLSSFVCFMNMHKHTHTNCLACTLPPARTNTPTYTRQTIDRNGNMACLFTDHQKALSKSIDSNGNFVSTSLNCPGRSSELAVPTHLVGVDDPRLDARLSLAPGVCRGDFAVDEGSGDFSASPTVVTSSGEESMVPCSGGHALYASVPYASVPQRLRSVRI